MKKIHVVLLPIIILEIIFTIYFYSNDCGSACKSYSLVNPLGFGSVQEICFGMCASPGPLFYVIADLFILTVIVYILLLYKKFKKNTSYNRNPF